MSIVTFGKYKGMNVTDIPSNYLEWGIGKLDSLKWKNEFKAELKRRKNEIEKQQAFIKESINTNEVWQILLREAEMELESSDEDIYTVVRQSGIEALAKQKLQKHKSKKELEELDKDFIEKWGVNKSQIEKIQNEFWENNLSQSMFSSQGVYESALLLAAERDKLISIIYDFS